MPKTTKKITITLKQLSKTELLKLASKKKAKIPKSWTKTQIIRTLTTITTIKDLQKPKPKKSKSLTKTKITTPKKKIKKNSLEDRVTKIFIRKGYVCTKNVQIEGIKINIIGYKKGNIFTNDKHLIVECKEKTKVTPEDLKKFLANTILYLRRKNLNPDHVQTYIYTTGKYEKEVRTQAKKFPILKLERLQPLKKNPNKNSQKQKTSNQKIKKSIV